MYLHFSWLCFSPIPFWTCSCWILEHAVVNFLLIMQHTYHLQYPFLTRLTSLHLSSNLPQLYDTQNSLSACKLDYRLTSSCWLTNKIIIIIHHLLHQYSLWLCEESTIKCVQNSCKTLTEQHTLGLQLFAGTNFSNFRTTNNSVLKVYAFVLCVEPFGYGGDISACTVRTVCWAIWGMEAISQHVYCV